MLSGRGGRSQDHWRLLWAPGLQVSQPLSLEWQHQEAESSPWMALQPMMVPLWEYGQRIALEACSVRTSEAEVLVVKGPLQGAARGQVAPQRNLALVVVVVPKLVVPC